MVHLYYLFALFEIKINSIEDADRICNFDLIQDIYVTKHDHGQENLNL